MALFNRTQNLILQSEIIIWTIDKKKEKKKDFFYERPTTTLGIECVKKDESNSN